MFMKNITKIHKRLKQLLINKTYKIIIFNPKSIKVKNILQNLK